MVVEQEIRPLRDPVQKRLMAETVGGKMSELDKVTLSLVKVYEYFKSANRQDQVQPCIFVGPYYLTVSSSGPVGEKQYSRMGVYRQSGETHNNRPVWSRHDGTMKLFYGNGKFIL